MSRSMYRRRSSAIQSFVLRKKNEIDIVLDQSDQPMIRSYSTHDKIEGKVTVKFDKDTTFTDLLITFEGQTNTYVEKVATSAPTTGRATGKHIFLKLVMPVDPSHLPEGGTAKAGVTYSVPFTFVVPERLLPQICSHTSHIDDIHDMHLQLPPSFGDPMVASDGTSLMDDLAPEMSKIIYYIRARVAVENNNGYIINIADKTTKIRIVPARDELPPVDVADDNKDYVLRKEKDVKKGLFKIGKIGRLTAEATQPKSLRLPPPRSRSQAPVTTMTMVNLRFDPNNDEDQPPPLGSIVSKLKAQTFFGASPFSNVPSKSNINAWDTQKGFYVDTVELSSRCISTVTWVRHESNETASLSNLDEMRRRPSVLSTTSVASIPEPSSLYSGRHFWTANVLVPISLPKNKSFPPSFHSCIISRVYCLDMSISYSTPGTTVSNPSIVLKLPIQVSSEPSPDAAPTIGEEEAEAIARREAEGYFLPRSIAPPSPEYTERAVLAAGRHASVAGPPGYSLFSASTLARGPPATPLPARTQSIAC